MDNQEINAVETASTPSAGKKKRLAFLKNRKFRFGAASAGVTAVVVALCVLLNVVVGLLNDRFPLTLDLTSNAVYSLSQESRDFAKSIDKDVTITVLMPEETVERGPFSSDYEELNKIFLQFHEMAAQYQQVSGGKVKVEYVDLTSNPGLQSEYQKYDATTYDILFRCGNDYKTIHYDELFEEISDSSSYSIYGTTASYDSKVETVLAARISALIDERDIGVTLLVGHGEEASLLEGITDMCELNGYSVEQLNLTTQSEFAENSRFAIIVAPSADYTDEELTRLRGWLNNEGKLERNLMVLPASNTKIADIPNLVEFLQVDYGIEITDEMFYETEPSRMAVLSYSYNPYYTYATVAASDYTSLIADQSVISCFTRRLVTHYANDSELSLYNVPLLTFGDSTRVTDLNKPDEDGKELDSYPGTGMAMAVKYIYDNDTAGNPKLSTHVIVGGTELLFYQPILEMKQVANEDLFLALINGITGNKSTRVISSKSVRQKTLEFSAGTQTILGLWVFTILLPVVLLVVCLVVFIKRKNL